MKIINLLSKTVARLDGRDSWAVVPQATEHPANLYVTCNGRENQMSRIDWPQDTRNQFGYSVCFSIELFYKRYQIINIKELDVTRYVHIENIKDTLLFSYESIFKYFATA